MELMANDSVKGAVVIPSNQAAAKPDVAGATAASDSRIAPLASVENSTSNLLQTTTGQHSWKKFDDEDEDRGASPGNQSDESTSDSSDEDDGFSDSFAALQGSSSNKTNACIEAKVANGNAPLASSLGTGKAHSKNNGVLYNGLEITENNNNFNEVRPAIQTDF